MFHQLTDGEKRGKRWIRLVKTGANEQSLKNRGKRGIELQNKGSCTIVPTVNGVHIQLDYQFTNDTIII